jgi:hypothetical protein
LSKLSDPSLSTMEKDRIRCEAEEVLQGQVLVTSYGPSLRYYSFHGCNSDMTIRSSFPKDSNTGSRPKYDLVISRALWHPDTYFLTPYAL